MTAVNTHDFTMDPNLLVSVIKAQAGTLSKAILEGVMNSVDAGAKSIEVSLDKEQFTIRDNGRGFSSEEEVKLWFGRFGTPHTENDAVFGRFRMGRGQMMAFARTEWVSGPFRMQVDIENKGLQYDLEALGYTAPGCEIKGTLYQPLQDYKLSTVLAELKSFVAFCPVPVHVNGTLFGAPASRLKSWTFEDEDAYYKLSQEARDLQVYNQGILVEEMGAWRIGMGGIVVSKGPLLVNFARNSVMEDRCPRWRRISDKIEQLVLTKLTAAKKLSDTERTFLARHLLRLRALAGDKYLKAKLLTDPTGKHIALGELAAYKRFVYTEEISPKACALHGQDGTFVVTEALLARFGASSIEEFLDVLKRLDSVLVPAQYEVKALETLSAHEVDRVSMLESSDLSRRRSAAFTALSAMNDALSRQLGVGGTSAAGRELLLGTHKGKQFVAWTDGKTYITANAKFLKLFEKGQKGIYNWVLTLVHEYTHDTDDSESHAHGEVFYRKFHDTLFDFDLDIAGLVQLGLKTYLDALKAAGLPQPNELKRQLTKTKGKKVPTRAARELIEHADCP